jgi:hypothetical protein
MRSYSYKRLLLGLSVLGLALVILVALNDYGGPSALADSPEGQRITVSPAAVSYEDRIEITVAGLPREVTLHADAVTLGGIRVPMPGYFGHPGEKPKSDKLGNLTFSAPVPAGVPLGLQPLMIDLSHIFLASTTVDFLGASLSTDPRTAVANETVLISGSGFTPASVKGGWGLEKIHLIDGRGPRAVILNGEMLRSPNVDYPIHLDKDGNFFSSITLPVTNAVTKGGNLELRVTDSGGRTGSVYLTAPTPSVAFDPPNTFPRETLRIQGKGFAASNPVISAENEVRIDYKVVYNEGKSNQYYYPRLSTMAIVDGSGNFSTQFKVPRQAKIPSSNLVSITPNHGEVVHVIHKIPPPLITADPNAVFPNQQVEITLGGIGADYKIYPGTVTLGKIPMPIPGYLGYPGSKPKTDQGGRVTLSSTVPENIPTGLQYLDFRLSGDRLLRSNIAVLTADLKMTPETAAPGQLVVVSSLNLSPADEGAPGPFGNHQIVGNGASNITLGEKRLGRPQVVYPVDLDTKGRLFVSFEVPVNDVTLAGGRLEIRVTDTGGRTGIGAFKLKTPVMTVSPVTSIRGSLVKVTGDGFVVASLNDTSRYQIDIIYAGRIVASTEIAPSGAFNVSFKVPSDIKINSENVVTAKVRQLPSETDAVHTVPDTYIAIEPPSAPRGGKVTITGTGFPVFQQVWIRLGKLYGFNKWVLLSGVNTDVNGAFTAVISIPQETPLGEQVVLARTPGLSHSSTIEVTTR